MTVEELANKRYGGGIVAPRRGRNGDHEMEVV